MVPPRSNPAPTRRRTATGIALGLPLLVLVTTLAWPGAASAGVFGPDLTTDITDAPDPVGPGATTTFTVVVTNTGSEDAYEVELSFDTGGEAILAAQVTGAEGSGCSFEGTSAVCSLGFIPTDSVSDAESPGIAALAFNQAEATFDVEAPSVGPSFVSNASATAIEQSDENPLDNDASETTTVSGGDSDAGPIPPGGSLSTVQGTSQNPVSSDDPVALELKNVSDQTLVGSIEEQECDGTQEGDALCSRPRLGGTAGDFQFSPSAEEIGLMTSSSSSPPVTVAKLFYDRTLVRQADGVRIFYQQSFGGPVRRLQRCDDGLRTECFTSRKLGSGDQIIRVPLSSDPRVTRG